MSENSDGLGPMRHFISPRSETVFIRTAFPAPPFFFMEGNFNEAICILFQELKKQKAEGHKILLVPRTKVPWTWYKLCL